MSGVVGLAAALSAGILSFLSPCVLPIVPGYLSFMTGLTSSELAEENVPLKTVLVPSALFVAGFSLVFVAFGASASMLGRYLVEYRDIVAKVAGVVVIGFGVLMTGWVKVPWLYGEARLGLERSRAFGRGASFVMGMAFAAGWTPCVGPILGSILALAATAGSASRGALLLLVYSLGLGVPFLATAVLFGRLRGLLRWVGRHSLAINRVGGLILIAIGLLILTDRMGMLAGWLANVLPGVEI